MHELAVTQSILEISLRHARQAGAKRVTNLHLVIGQLASIVDDSVQFYWDIVAKDTPAEGAQLEFKRIPTELLCKDCEKRYQPPPGELDCPLCGGMNVQVVAGEEFYLEAIDVEN
jgi:hydrogenase nickel incorporation protein HypA/HybF